MSRLGWGQARIERVQPEHLYPPLSNNCCGAVGEVCARSAALLCRVF